MKKILPWLLLLLLLIIFCVWTKKDTIHVSSKNNTNIDIAPAITENVHYINYNITQEDDKSYTLDGNFKNTKQQISLSNIFNDANKKLMIKNTSTNDTLLGEPAVELTSKILPLFISQYTNGKINYNNQKLNISGVAKNYEAQHEMQRLLNTSKLPSVDNSSVAPAKDIEYTINKNKDTLHFTGTFKNQAQIDTIKSKLPKNATSDFKIIENSTDKGSLSIVEKLLPTFIAKYTSGKIEYTDEKLTVSGMVKSKDDLMKVTNLLHGTNIPVNNQTIVDPEIEKAKELARKAKEEADAKAVAEAARKAKEVAALAIAEEAERKAKEEANAKAIALAESEASKGKEAADAKAIADAEAEAARKAKEEADAKVIANAKEAERKAKEAADAKAIADADAEKAKLEKQAKADELKAKIAALFKLENISFNINKSTLTTKGRSTVNTLAKILKEYTNVNIEIAGHTDSDGSAKYNQKLSQSRVDMVKTKLIEQNISASRLTAKGYGETKPLVPNTTRANKAKNRRVEINIQGE